MVSITAILISILSLLISLYIVKRRKESKNWSKAPVRIKGPTGDRDFILDVKNPNYEKWLEDEKKYQKESEAKWREKEYQYIQELISSIHMRLHVETSIPEVFGKHKTSDAIYVQLLLDPKYQKGILQDKEILCRLPSLRVNLLRAIVSEFKPRGWTYIVFSHEYGRSGTEKFLLNIGVSKKPVFEFHHTDQFPENKEISTISRFGKVKTFSPFQFLNCKE